MQCTCNRTSRLAAAAVAAWLGDRCPVPVMLVRARRAFAQAPAAPAARRRRSRPRSWRSSSGPIALYPDDLVAIILPASTIPAADRAGRSLSRQAQGRSQASRRRQVGRRGEVAAQLSRRREDDERRPRLDQRARRGGRRRPGRGARGRAGVPPQGAGGGQPQVRRQAGREGRAGDRQHRAGRSAGDLRAAVQPDDRRRLRAPRPSTATTRRPTRRTTTRIRPAPRSPPASIWGAAIGAAWGGNRYGCCGDVNINVNRNTNINHTATSIATGARQQPASGSTAWKSNKQPGQVSSSVGKTASSARAGDARAGGAVRARRGGGARAAQPAGARTAGCQRRRRRGAGARKPRAADRRRQRHARRRVGRRRLRRLRLRAADRRRWTARAAHRAAVRCRGGGAAVVRRRWWRWRRAAVVAAAAAAAAAVVEAGSTFMRTFPHIDGKASAMNIIGFWLIAAPARAGADRWPRRSPRPRPAADLRDAGGGGRRADGRAQGRQRSGDDRDLRRRAQGPHRRSPIARRPAPPGRRSSRRCRRCAC